MSGHTKGSEPGPLSLPEKPSLDWLRKEARRVHHELLQADPKAQLSDAQFDLAKRYGFSSWRALKARVDSLTIEGQLFEAAKTGDVATLARLLDQHPDRMTSRSEPYEWTLLHTGARHLSVVNLLLERGMDVNALEKGDRTYAMHWAAAGGEVEVVRRLIEAGGDVIGKGDDHELEVIGWASCWDGCDDQAHKDVVDLLLAHGAHHHIFSAIALGLAGEVRRIVADDPSALNRRMSRNENNQLPLHFAVRFKRPEMVNLLLELGADPLGVDDGGQTAATYVQQPGQDKAVLQAVNRMTLAELDSADRGKRKARGAMMDLVAAISLGDYGTAERLLKDDPQLLGSGALHLMAKRGDVTNVRWLLDHKADTNAIWDHWQARVTPLHLASWQGHIEVVRLLLAAGADPNIKDSQFHSGSVGWAYHGGHQDIVRLLEEHGGKVEATS